MHRTISRRYRLMASPHHCRRQVHGVLPAHRKDPGAIPSLLRLVLLPVRNLVLGAATNDLGDKAHRTAENPRCINDIGTINPTCRLMN